MSSVGRRPLRSINTPAGLDTDDDELEALRRRARGPEPSSSASPQRTPTPRDAPQPSTPAPVSRESPRKQTSGQIHTRVRAATRELFTRDRVPISELISDAVASGATVSREQVDAYMAASPTTELVKYNLPKDVLASLDVVAQEHHVGRQVIISLLLADLLDVDVP